MLFVFLLFLSLSLSIDRFDGGGGGAGVVTGNFESLLMGFLCSAVELLAIALLEDVDVDACDVVSFALFF